MDTFLLRLYQTANGKIFEKLLVKEQVFIDLGTGDFMMEKGFVRTLG